MNLRTESLADVCELIVDCPHSTPEWTKSGYLVIRNQNIRDGRLDLSERSFTNQVDYLHRVRRAKPRGGDIIFTREAPMGEVCVVPDDLECCVGQRQVLLRPREDMAARYLFYALRSPFVRHQIFWNEGTGSTVSNVRIPILKALRIPRMDELEKVVGDTLGSLEDKIELNRQMNETLEAMAQAIFRDWFVDFGPVRRKLAGETDPVSIMGGLSPDPVRAAELAALFPADLSDVGLPSGWPVRIVTDVATVTGGKQLDKANIQDVGPNPVFGGAGIMGFSAQSNAKNFVITVGRVGAYCGQFFYHRGTAWVNNNASLISPKAGIPPEWLLLSLRSADIDGIKRGAAQPFVSNGDVGKIEVIGTDNVSKAFADVAGPLFLAREQREGENRILAQTRDYLLPRLMSGELRVTPSNTESAAA